MELHLDRNSTVALYLQIRDGIIALARRGQLPPAYRLPPTRDLAGTLGVTRVTVVKAYDALVQAGWATAHVGRGTFITAGPAGQAALRHVPAAAAAAAGRGAHRPDVFEPAWRALSRLAERPGVINFASGAPAPGFFPVDDLRRAINEVFDKEGAAALQYDAPEGLQPLREQIAAHVGCNGEDVLVTSGTQQALDLIARSLLRPGDLVLTEAPTYSGALEAFAAAGARLSGVPVDSDGLDVAALSRLLQFERPRLLYTVPSFMTPYGTAMSPARRDALLALAVAHDLIIVEDDAYRELTYDAPPLPPLRAMSGEAEVLHVGSFSKLLAPGLRLGYLVATAATRQALTARKQAADLHTSTLIQHAVSAYLAGGSHATHLERIRALCQERRDAAIAAVQGEQLPDCKWHVPSGGPFLWLQLPPGQAATDFYLQAVDHGVAFAIGAIFYPDRSDRGWLRLNFTLHEPERIREGIARLAAAWRQPAPDAGLLPL